MKTTFTQHILAAALTGALAFTTTISHAADALPSWNDGKTKESIVAFVAKVTKAGSPDGEPAIAPIVMHTHAGMTTGEFEKIVKDWLATAKDPLTKRPRPLG